MSCFVVQRPACWASVLWYPFVQSVSLQSSPCFAHSDRQAITRLDFWGQLLIACA